MSSADQNPGLPPPDEVPTDLPVEPGPQDIPDGTHGAALEGTPDALDEETLSQLSDLEEEYETPKIKDLLQSSDPPSRYMTALSIIFATLATLCFSMLIAMYIKHRHLAKKPPPEKVEQEVIITQPLGEFKVFLKSHKPGSVELEMRADLVAECTTQEACDTIKEHLAEARDLVAPILAGATQNDMMQTASKNLIKRKATDRLNSLSMKGKVLQIDITNMTLERGQ